MRESTHDKWTRENRERIKRLQGEALQKAEDRSINGIEDLIKLMLDGQRPKAQRQINPTQMEYMMSEAKLKVYMGPAGSGKSAVGCADIILRALLMPGTKWFIARRDYNDLMDTTMRTCTNILQNLPDGTLLSRVKTAPQKWLLRPIATNADLGGLPSEITFMGLSDNVGSYEYTGGFIDEMDEVEEQYFDQLKMRLRSRPFPDFPDHNFFIGGAFNPPGVTHWLYRECTGLNPAGTRIKEPSIKLYRPQPRENARNLPNGYYEEMGATLSTELRQRLVEGVWGNTYPGEPVIRQFSRELHVKKLKYGGGTLYRFWDFGYNRPAVLFAQVTLDGRLEVLKEYLGHHIEGTKFIEQVHALTAQEFPDAVKFMDYGDPAVAQHKDTGSMLGLLNNAGILMRYIRTPFDVSLNVMRKRFESQIEKVQAIQIDESCRILCDGLVGGYHVKEDGTTPKKDGLFDHLIDALRYGIWAIWGANSFAVDVSNLPNSIAYWDRRT